MEDNQNNFHPQSVTQPTTPEPTRPVDLPSITQFVKLAFSRFFARTDVILPGIGVMISALLPIIVGALVIAVAVGEVGDFEMANGASVGLGVIFIVIGIITAIVGTILNTGAMFYVFGRYDEHNSYGTGLRWAWGHFFILLWVGILSFAIGLTSLALFILPAIVFGLYTTFTILPVVAENQRGLSAIIRSVDLTRGRVWGIWIRLFALGLVLGIIGSIIDTVVQIVSESLAGESVLGAVFVFGLAVASFLVQLLTGWISIVGSALLFDYRRLEKPQFQPEKYSTLRWILRIAAVIALIIPITGGYLVHHYYDDIVSVLEYEQRNSLDDDWFLEVDDENTSVRIEGDEVRINDVGEFDLQLDY